MKTLIQTGKYRDIEYKIFFASGSDLDWGDWKNKFFVKADFNFTIDIADKDIEVLISNIEKDIDRWYNEMPTDVKTWVKLMESCVVRDGYEEWHVDPVLAMSMLNKYAELKKTQSYKQ